MQKNIHNLTLLEVLNAKKIFSWKRDFRIENNAHDRKYTNIKG